MNREEKRYLEYAFVHAFIQTLGEFPIEALIHDDHPDFFIRSSRQIGIELTQIYNTINKFQNRAYVEGSRDKLLVKLKEIWDSRGLPGCHIQLMFRAATPLPDRSLDEVAFQIIDLVVGYVPNRGSTFMSPDSMLIKVPNITGFSIERICHYDESLWSYYDSILPPNLSIDLIQRTIDKKESKRREYLMRCDEIWLVIALYGGKASGSFEIPLETINHEYENYFDRSFLFDCLPKKIIELRKEL